MNFIEGKPLSGYLREPTQEIVTLRSNIHMPVLRRAYFGMPEILPELPKPEFPFIGAVRPDGSGKWTVQKRPFTFNMNRLAQYSNIPHNIFGQQHFDKQQIISRSLPVSISTILGYNATMQ